MSVVIETTQGDLTVDLFTKERPKTCLNFLKLCKTKAYNLNLFHTVQPDFIAQTGDPSGTGRGGESIFSQLYGEQVIMILTSFWVRECSFEIYPSRLAILRLRRTPGSSTLSTGSSAWSTAGTMCSAPSFSSRWARPWTAWTGSTACSGRWWRGRR